MKKLLSLSIVFSVALSALAQVDSPTSYSSFFTLSASRYEPGNLGEDHEKFEIALINAYAWIGNTSLDASSLSDFSKNFLDDSFVLPKTEMLAIIDKMGPKNRLGLGATVDLMNMMYKFTNGEGDEVISVGLGIADRMESNLVFPNNIFPLALYGNRQYAGEEIDLSMTGGSFYAREYTASFAMPIPIEIEDWTFRAGARLKYIQGIDAIYSDQGAFSLFTQEQGQYLELNYDYTLNSSIDFDDSTYSFSPFSSRGKGYGADLGISATFKDRWHGNINILDLGSVTFKGENNLRYQKSGTFKYEGLFFDDVIDESDFPVDSVLEALVDELTDDNTSRGEDFTMPYPTRLRMHLSYRVPRENTKGHTYYQHMMGVNLIQGFRDLGNATTRTYLAGSYTYNLNDVFEVGTNIGLLGYNKMEFGAFMAVKLGFFRLGLGSGNLTPIVRSFGTGADFNFNMTLAF